MNRRSSVHVVATMAIAVAAPRMRAQPVADSRPNILFCISDDQSWCHTSIAGEPVIKTPNFDRVAREGLLFNNAYTSCPSCAPSRASILTGQDFWRLEEGGLLFGRLQKKFAVYPHLLEKSGYVVGKTGKGYKPADRSADYCWKDPAGEGYGDRRQQVPPGIKDCDYIGNFKDFLNERDPGSPFCFWYGCHEPHRGYDYGIGARSGLDPNKVTVPPFLPDVEEVRNDLCDYFYEVQWFDKYLGKMLALLEETGELDNTLIVVTSDNGMPFPRAKASAYHYGVHMPLAIRWGRGITKPGRVVDDFVNHIDFAPTFLEAAGLGVPEQMTGRSLMPILKSAHRGQVVPERTMTVTGLERHVWCRPEGKPYPRRAIYTHDFIYIRNYEPDRWPMGDPSRYGDIDGGPSKKYMERHKTDATVRPLFAKAFEKLPAEELYAVRKDPDQMTDLAALPEYGETKKKLREQMEAYQARTNDPRVRGEAPWDDYPFYRQGKTEFLKGSYLEEFLKRRGAANQ
jgi:N-sulfoglucosamine sulfohydrolase